MHTRSFGVGKNGEAVTLYTFENKNGMSIEVTDFGATLYSVIVPDKDGNPCDVVLGYDSPQDYMRESFTCFGAVIGRSANRIGGGKFVLNGKEYQLDKTQMGNNLHSGYDYYHHRVWNVKETTEKSITFALHSPDGDQGYPGALDLEVKYTLTDDNEICLDYLGKPDADTIVNLTNHSYFNLSGHASGNILDHNLWVDADAFIPTDAALIPTGEIAPVEGTPMDFRVKKPVGRDIDSKHEAIVLGGGYDHNWCLNNKCEFAKVAELTSDVSGITLEVHTDRPGMQVYTGNFIVEEPGKGGVTYRYRQGMCFETQEYPDAINHENFPCPVAKGGEDWKTRTVFKFV